VWTNARITAVQAALLNCQLDRLDSQLDTRRARVERLVTNWDAESVLEPISPPPDSTWGIYNVPFRFRPELADRLTRDGLVSALQAEGCHAHRGHLTPVYTHDVFRDGRRSFRNDGCPSAEEAARSAVVFSQRMFLGPPEWMERIAEVVAEVSARPRQAAEAVAGDSDAHAASGARHA
jgi:dTDP-4-amino-4,6-dideoxygalactose transaminase